MSGTGTLSLSVSGLGALSLVSEPGAFCVGRTESAGPNAESAESAPTQRAPGPTQRAPAERQSPTQRATRGGTESERAPGQHSAGPALSASRPWRSLCRAQRSLALCVGPRRSLRRRALCARGALCVGLCALSALAVSGPERRAPQQSLRRAPALWRSLCGDPALSARRALSLCRAGRCVGPRRSLCRGRRSADPQLQSARHASGRAGPQLRSAHLTV